MADSRGPQTTTVISRNRTITPWAQGVGGSNPLAPTKVFAFQTVRASLSVPPASRSSVFRSEFHASLTRAKGSIWVYAVGDSNRRRRIELKKLVELVGIEPTTSSLR